MAWWPEAKPVCKAQAWLVCLIGLAPALAQVPFVGSARSKGTQRWCQLAPHKLRLNGNFVSRCPPTAASFFWQPAIYARWGWGGGETLA